jgi:mRNA interferase RelE/StbE
LEEAGDLGLFKLRFLGKALDDLSRIDRPHQKIIKAKLLMLAKNPEALKNNIRRIVGTDEALYRLRVGSYRIIFKKEEDALVIIIIRIGHRKEVYLSMN